MPEILAYPNTAAMPETTCGANRANPRVACALLQATRKPFVIENVPEAPLIDAIELCGVMFGLKVFRHRKFESNCLLMQPEHIPHGNRTIGRDGFCCVAGHGDSGKRKFDAAGNCIYGRVPKDHRTLGAWSNAMGIHWMLKREITQALPPEYTKMVGLQLMQWL